MRCSRAPGKSKLGESKVLHKAQVNEKILDGEQVRTPRTPSPWLRPCTYVLTYVDKYVRSKAQVRIGDCDVHFVIVFQCFHFELLFRTAGLRLVVFLLRAAIIILSAHSLRASFPPFSAYIKCELNKKFGDSMVHLQKHMWQV